MLKRISIVIFVLLNVGCDQLSKELVRKHVEPMDYIQVVNDNFILTNVENTGAMLGFGQSLPPTLKMIFLQGIPLIVLLILLTRTIQKSNLNRWLALAFAFVIGGGIGNLIDRIAYGSVTDFFLVKLGFIKTGIFNMADVSVTIGVFLLLFVTIRYRNLSI
ncbi:signal peptidase II [Maribacter polysiphoniae]|uniref:Lipoprotein signal peptidase n=1 Tax=Maribacter polysiphoniae TaxID=429344 RepID=A0A316E0G2_9FLAO|nr:signal peptidase II [Maribacter polysiphoniae]MBD1261292.1 signal peptidase II [Maribacter polysiphoniae]PWK23466.1 signal peptidase II [Maribacter polysiphoniae]